MFPRAACAARGAAFVLVLASASTLSAQSSSDVSRTAQFLTPAATDRIADPKLSGGGVEVRYRLAPGRGLYDVRVTVRRSDDSVFATVFDGVQGGRRTPLRHRWNGTDATGAYPDPGAYRLHVEASSRGETRTLTYDLAIVRLGITEIEAQSSSAQVNEWQMVYFRKGANQYRFYATPANREYRCTKDEEQDEISDLDLDDGSPRSAVAVHQETDSPVLEQRGGKLRYDNDQFNYPVCYLRGAQPQFEVTFGATATSSSGQAVGVGYPVEGFEMRCVANDGHGQWASDHTEITPDGTAVFLGPALPDTATRQDRVIRWTYEYRATGDSAWSPIRGGHVSPHRFFTNWDEPQWALGASGTQYSGPWVEVAQNFYDWQVGLGSTVDSDAMVVETFMKGYFGQNGPLLTAIEDVRYDCPSEGGDGGATHYYDWGAGATNLSRLLHQHDLGPFVNCSDVASTTSAMLGMMGVSNMQMVRLGTMSLKAIWGIGTPNYTLDLWSNGNHGFSYHHIITRDNTVTVSDSCMWLDDDASPETLPGLPGYNHDRPWSDYNDRSSYNNTSKRTDPLPKIW